MNLKSNTCQAELAPNWEECFPDIGKMSQYDLLSVFIGFLYDIYLKK